MDMYSIEKRMKYIDQHLWSYVPYNDTVYCFPSSDLKELILKQDDSFIEPFTLAGMRLSLDAACQLYWESVEYKSVFRTELFAYELGEEQHHIASFCAMYYPKWNFSTDHPMPASRWMEPNYASMAPNAEPIKVALEMFEKSYRKCRD